MKVSVCLYVKVCPIRSCRYNHIFLGRFMGSISVKEINLFEHLHVLLLLLLFFFAEKGFLYNR